MTDLFLADSYEVPLPPEEVRILDLSVDPYPDGRRLRVIFELTPFQKKPHGDLVIRDLSEIHVADTSFVEIVTPCIELTLHLRSFDPAGKYSASLTLFYLPEIGNGNLEDQSPERLEKQIVDEKKIFFEIGLG